MLFSLKSLLQWKPDAGEFTAPLTTPQAFQFRVDRFPKGIDNAHVDVYLSPKFIDATHQLIKRLIQHEAGEVFGQRKPAPSMADIEQFRKTYSAVMEAGMGMARKTSQPELIQLLQFSVIKFLLESVASLLRQHRESLQHAQTYGDGQSSMKAVQLHEQLVKLAKEEPELHRRVTQKLFMYLYKLETMNLRKLRKSMLGRSWPIPKRMLFNPMLHLSSLWHDEQLMKSYTLVGTDKDDLRVFDRVNRIVTGLFKEFLPEWSLPPVVPNRLPGVEEDSDSTQLRQRQDQGTLNGFLEVELLLNRALRDDEYLEGRTSWLDDPENMERIIHWSPKGLERRKQPGALKEVRQWQHFHTLLLDQIYHELRRSGFLKKVLAARETPGLYEEFHGEVPVRLLEHYLEGGLSGRQMQKRLAGLHGLEDPAAVYKALSQKRGALNRMPKAQQRRVAHDFLKDFLILRRDLKLAYQAYWIMNQVRLLTHSEDIELSRSNRSLHEFVLVEEQRGEQHHIRSHVIIKADLRGSTRITDELRAKNLNPATHFSLNFFGPINKLLERFGAKKVFVEGDAVILAIYEYEDAPYDWLSVARACGLSLRILEVVDTQNAQNRKYSLPELELGLGVTYRDEAPAFLFDGDHEIMISPAINRADRLSSCAKGLRKTSLEREVKRGVEVVAPVDQGIQQKQGEDNLLRYNVNGVELDAEAFHKLKTEMAMHKVSGPVSGYSEQSLFYLGRYPDKNGAMQWIIIREAPIRLWIGNDASTEEEWGRHFYEVITSAEVLAQLKRQVRQANHNVDKTGVGEVWSDQTGEAIRTQGGPAASAQPAPK